MQVFIDDLVWSSDWNGYEVGYPGVEVVGLYVSDSLECDFYIDASTGEILDVFKEQEEF